MIELAPHSTTSTQFRTLPRSPQTPCSFKSRRHLQDTVPVVTVVADPTQEQLRTWWDAMHDDDLSVAYNDDFPTTLTDFRLDVEQGTKLLALILVDGQVAAASWLHDMVYRDDGTIAAGWVGGYVLPAYRGVLGKNLWHHVKRHWEAEGIEHFFAAAHIANRRSQVFISRGMRFHRVGVYPQFSFYDGHLTDVVFYVANQKDAQLARQCAAARAQRLLHTPFAA